MESLKGASSLHDEWEKVKENLKGVDENIKKLYGRDPTESRIGQRRVSRNEADGGGSGGVGRGAAGRLFNEARRIMNNPNREPIRGAPDRIVGRTVSLEGTRFGSIQSRLGPKRKRDSDDELDAAEPRPAVQSSVVMQQKEPPKREDSAAMKTDKKAMARNRRMFGALLGTLQRFQNDSKKDQDKEKRRAEVEKKLEQKQREEQNQLRQERAALWTERREKQRELRQLEYKMRIVKMFEQWEKTMRCQANFIKTTKAKRYIFYKPKVMLPANNRALDETEDFIDGIIKDRKLRLEAEIEKVMSRPVRRLGEDGDKKERGSSGEDSSDSDSDSDKSESSDLEDGEVPTRKRARNDSESNADRPIKQEKEDDTSDKSLRIKETDKENNQGQVSNEAGDAQVKMETSDTEEQDRRNSDRIESKGKGSEDKLRRSERRAENSSSPKRDKNKKSKLNNQSGSSSGNGSSSSGSDGESN